MKFTEEKLENAIIEFLAEQTYTHVLGASLVREPQDVLITQDMHAFLTRHFQSDDITPYEIDTVIRDLQVMPASYLYDSNTDIMKWVSDGYPLKREDHTHKDFHLSLLDYDDVSNNVFKLVNQMEIVGTEMRIPDTILYVNGIA